MIERVERVRTHGTATREAQIADVVARLREGGGRVTRSRVALLEVLFDNDGHHSAESLVELVHARVPEVHLSTVYRNLEEFQRLGIVVHSHLGHAPPTYQLAATAHPHLVCERCGARLEVPTSYFDELRRRAQTERGFVVDPLHVAIAGRCRGCVDQEG